MDEGEKEEEMRSLDYILKALSYLKEVERESQTRTFGEKLDNLLFMRINVDRAMENLSMAKDDLWKTSEFPTIG